MKAKHILPPALRSIPASMALGVALLLCVVVSQRSLADSTWNGSGNGNWVTANNWEGGNFPGNNAPAQDSPTAGTAQFYAVGTGSATTVSLGTAGIAQVNFNPGAAAFTFQSGTLGLGETNDGITDDSLNANNETFASSSTIVTGIPAGGNSNIVFNNENTPSGGQLIINGNVTGVAAETGTTTLNLEGETGVSSGTISGNISNGASSGEVVAVSVASGVWALSGANSYTGSTIINAGTLQLGSTTALGNTSSVKVNGTGSLNVSNGVTPQTTTFSGGGRTLTVNSGASLDFGVANAGADELVISGGATMAVNGTITINPTLLSGTGISTPQVIISDAAGGLNDATFVLGYLPALSTGFLTQTGSTVSLEFTGVSTVYWEGNGTSIPGFWSDYSNFTSDQAGTTMLTGSFGPAQDVVFSANGATNQTAGANFLDANITAHSLTINDPAGVDIAGIGNNTLTLSGNTGHTGITVGSAAGAAQAEIDAYINLAGTPNITVNNTGGLLITGVISGTNGLIVNGASTVILSAYNVYTGSTTVSSGTLKVNGSIASSSGVYVALGASLGGYGYIPAVSGPGMIAPGDPHILTAPQLDPSSGMSFYFHFSQPGSPTYGNASASGNDVLRLTGATPFVFSLTSANTITVDFTGDILAGGQVYKGGFYTDAAWTTAEVDATTFDYVGITGDYAAHYEGMVADTANFGAGPVNGTVMEFGIETIPEPSTWAMLAMGGAGLLAFVRRRRPIL